MPVTGASSHSHSHSKDHRSWNRISNNISSTDKPRVACTGPTLSTFEVVFSLRRNFRSKLTVLKDERKVQTKHIIRIISSKTLALQTRLNNIYGWLYNGHKWCIKVNGIGGVLQRAMQGNSVQPWICHFYLAFWRLPWQFSAKSNRFQFGLWWLRAWL